MTGKTPEDIAAETAANVSTARTSNKAGEGKAKKAVIILVVGAVTAGTLCYIWWPNSEPEPLKTSESTSFIKDSGDGFGNVTRPVLPKAVDPNPELIDKINKLEALINEMKNQPIEKVRDEGEINKLNDALKALKDQTDKAVEDYKNSLRDRDLELQRMQAELDLKRLAKHDNQDPEKLNAEQLYQRRVNSSLTPSGISNGGSGSAEARAGNNELAQRTLSQNERFAREQAKPVPVEQAKIIANPSNTVLQGTVLQASLETAINTDLPGAIRAVVSEDVHSLDGQRVLIPRGSKVLGKYSDTVSLGQKRVMVIWERILLPDNQTVTISAYGADAIGQSGVEGNVDSHFIERFGSATLISVIGIAPAVATVAMTNKNSGNKSNNNNDNTTTANTLASAMSQNMQSSLGEVIGDYLKRPPTIGVHQGANISIFVDRDLEIF